MRRHIFDSEECNRLLGTFVRTEEGPESQNESVIRSFNGLSVAYHFYKEVFGQISLDFRGSPLGASVHHHYSDGDGVYWLGFTSSLIITWHELTHRVISSSCKLIYNRQSGALNERLADIFGILMAQWHSKFDVTIASWLLGAELFSANVKGPGGTPAVTRSMKASRTGYHDPILGKDPQVDHMAKLWTKERDYGGVHFNSGTPNKLFYTVAAAMGGYSWKTVGPFWYYVMTQSGLRSSATFQDFASALMKAAKSFGSSKLQRGMKQAWADVGIDV